MNLWTGAIANAKKDLRIELRAEEITLTKVFFAVHGVILA